jgi:RHS repeat-associated protein
MASLRLARFAAAFLLFSVFTAFAQQPTGVPSFGTYQGGINLGNLNVNIPIILYQKNGHGLPFAVNAVYNSPQWFDQGGSTWTINLLMPFSSVFPTDGRIWYNQTTVCTTQKKYSGFVFAEGMGTQHSFPSLVLTTGGCGGTQTSGTATSSDGLLQLTFNATNRTWTVTNNSGVQLNNPITAQTTLTDTNGNQITLHPNYPPTWTDTLGVNPVLTDNFNNATDGQLTYTGPSGAETIHLYSSAQTLVSGPAWGCATAAVPQQGSYFPTQTVFPDGRIYSFTWEHVSGGTTGRLASITLPTGGIISYSYNGPNGGMNCDGSTSGMTVTTPDGTWAYTHTISGTTGATTVIDPVGTKTVYTFYQSTSTSIPYETEHQVYNNQGGLVKTVWTCYNGNTGNCPAASVSIPITQRSLYTWMGNYGALPAYLGSENYSSNGLLTDTYVYDLWNGSSYPLIRRTNIQYAALSGNILDRPAVITVYDKNGTIVAQTNYTGYDTHGNVGTVSRLVTTGQSLSTSFTYYAGGNVQTITDVNGAQSTYTYGSCNGAFPTSVRYVLNLSTSATWDCTGGVRTSFTDMNGQGTSYDYSGQPNWRLNTISDVAKTVNYRYNNVNDSEKWYTVNNGASVVDSRVTLDGLGRLSVVQREQAPASSYYDSVQTTYDALGRPSHSTLPYQGTAEQTNPLGPGKSFTYDTLGRVFTVVDSAGGTITNTYQGTYGADVLATVTPIPNGEHAHSKQYEYDGLGRLTSVCEITSQQGSGACGQSVGQTGYVTRYTYNALDKLISVTQGSQTRTFTYDDIGRLTSAANPENGTVTYYYDAQNLTCGTYNGDLTGIKDNAGILTCFNYDALHRVTSAGNGGMAGSVARYFVYDTALVNGRTMANTKGRLAEAYTVTVPNWNTKLTDEGFEYDAAGNAWGFHESTPSSGGWFNTNISYWPNRVPNVLSANFNGVAIAGMPIITYGLDSEGRIKTASADSGQNPLTNAAYSVAGLPTALTFGSGDADNYGYDPNTNRLTSYTFGVNGQNVTGTLTWNANSTLQQLAITDPFNTYNTQTCPFLYDDLLRVSSANCGAHWSQTFSYDAYGNVTKSGSSAWQPGYNSANNRYSSLGTYDANGNLLTDTFHIYTWDANWRTLSSVDGTNLTYDALGRMVEGGGKILFYDVRGRQYTVFSSGALSKAYIPLVGAQAIYTSGGLSRYQHTDWLGTSRFSSAPNRTLFYDVSFAPFGERYAVTGTTDINFTGQNANLSNDLYDFTFREYHPTQGRWISPDPAGLMAVDANDPQTWNRYAYLRGNPLNTTDFLGLWHCGGGDTEDRRDITESDCIALGGSWSSDPEDFSENLTFSGNPTDSILLSDSGQQDPGTFLPGNYGALNTITGVDSSDVAIGDNSAALAPAMNAGASFINFYVGTSVAIEGGAFAVATGAGPLTTVAARGLGWIYGLTGSGTGVVLGRDPEYLNAAKALGANALNVSNRIYNFLVNSGDWWTLNEAFLQASIFRGQQFLLSNAPLGQGGSNFAMELEYLTNRGIGAEFWQYVPLPFVWY